MTAAVVAFITGLDGPVFVGWTLILLVGCVYVACQVARLGQSQAVPTRTRPTSSNRKAGRA